MILRKKNLCVLLDAWILAYYCDYWQMKGKKELPRMSWEERAARRRGEQQDHHGSLISHKSMDVGNDSRTLTTQRGASQALYVSGFKKQLFFFVQRIELMTSHIPWLSYTSDPFCVFILRQVLSMLPRLSLNSLYIEWALKLWSF